MKITKEIVVCGMFVALLITAQFALSFVQGVEIVTVLFCAFCYVFGIKRGLVVATLFSLLRCLIFGFYLSVLVDYLIYYNLFAVVIGLMGLLFKRKIKLLSIVTLTGVAVVLTCCFTLIDDVVSPLIYGISGDFLKEYFLYSVPVMLTQALCTLITMAVLFVPLTLILNKINNN